MSAVHTLSSSSSVKKKDEVTKKRKKAGREKNVKIDVKDNEYGNLMKKNDEKSGKDTNSIDTSEVEDLFNALAKSKKKKKAEAEADAKRQKSEQEKERKEKKRSLAVKEEVLSFSDIISPDPPIHRWDKESGLPVYKCAALKTEDGGGTPLCPFDCNCCF